MAEILAQGAIISYLLGKGLLQPSTVVAGDIVVLGATRRNSNFKVVSKNGDSYLLKQGIGPARAATIANEADAYRLLWASGRSRMRRHLARLYLYSPQEQVLVLELFPAAETLGEYHRRLGRFPLRVAAALGSALGTLHSLDSAPPAVGSTPFARRGPPWILDLHRPTVATYQQLSAANVQLVRAVQRFPEFGRLLDALRGEWQQRAPAHYDIKGENILVTRAVAGRRRQLKIVDWEGAGLGDPCWDVGSVFGEYLGFWLGSIPVTGESPPERYLELARYPLHKIQPALRGFWQAYTSRLDLDKTSILRHLLRAVRYAGARLVQTAYEQEQMSARLSGNSLHILQLAFNILQRPHEAAAHLLGIPLVPVHSW